VFQIRFVILVSRQGKVRLTKWYVNHTKKEQGRYVREVTSLVLNRPPKQCNFLEWRGHKVVYKR
jgi:AP-1 complex subunit sigma 1/2